jgi:hypothetical protein
MSSSEDARETVILDDEFDIATDLVSNAFDLLLLV